MVMAKVKEKVQYCKDCGRIIDIGCACGMTFVEKMKSQSLIVPGSFRAVR